MSHSNHVGTVVERLRDSLPPEERDAAAELAADLYRNADPEDLDARSDDALHAIAAGLWRFSQTREDGDALVRVFNPTLEEHGWQSTHTIVEMVHDDMPFLVDSLGMVLDRHGLTTHMFVHPVSTAVGPGATSIMHVEVDRRSDAGFLSDLKIEIEEVLSNVRAAVSDWQGMRQQTLDVSAELAAAPAQIAEHERAETAAFLHWIADDNFVFLGYRCYDLVAENGRDALIPVDGSGLGILGARDATPGRSALLAGKARELAREPELLLLTKANSRSTVHRPIYLDYVGVKRFDDRGRVVGEHRILGLYTDRAYNSTPSGIPVLRRRAETVMEMSGLEPRSHDGKALRHILDTLPRAELFQSNVDELYATARNVLRIEERRRVRLLVRRDRYERFFACLAFVPRERYNTELREHIQRILLDGLDGRELQFSLTLSESVLARVYFVVRVRDRCPVVDVAAIEERISQAARDWRDDLRLALESQLGEEAGTALWPSYRNALPAGYRADVHPDRAVADIEQMERLEDASALGVSVYRRPEDEACNLRLKLYRRAQPLLLHELLPILENLGLRTLGERPYEVTPADRDPVYVHDFYTRHSGPESLDLATLQPLLRQALLEIWHRRAESDGFNRLVLRADLDVHKVAFLRAICKYLLQARIAFSQSYMERALGANPTIARRLVELVDTRFDPAASEGDDARRTERAGEIRGEILAALETVPSLDEDRILRAFLAVIEAMLRTNAYQHLEDRRGYLSFKLDPTRLPFLPEPRPQFEIFVYAPHFEGVHLRFGPVARGGIRWSDRLEDFRTEVLGLAKAQVVKNAVIVPIGAKGGFVVKPRTEDAPAPTREEAQSCYRGFIRGLLDITDNIVDGTVRKPPSAVCYDGDDAYLVVAADKGTATFSDIANGVAAEYDFWLGDGFASGGSDGYDHKVMGITARGAWESVKRHFRALDIDPERDAITAVGIGDMSGDVFGNGLLRSRTVRLLAAFNHRHIFVDPDPDPEASFAERRRLFELGSGSWDGYDPALVSAGGGVFPLDAKSIETTPEMRAALAFDDERLTPAEMVSRILQAPVDLLWNGGIGTFVKAGTETHADADDRSNDAVRVDASQLRCRVIAEGGNLGLTQRARVEYATLGGRINTDFIDNSGGVDTSDHEVNLKILLNAEVARGTLTLRQRNRLLDQMSEDVVDSVLLDNSRQALALSIAEARAPELLDAHSRVIRALERSGRINRELEGLPSEEALAERRALGVGLTRPEMAVLLAWAKIDVKSALIESDALDDPHFSRELQSYFGEALSSRFSDGLAQHHLRRNIVATKITNSLLNRAGPRFVHQIMEVTGADANTVVKAFVAAREVFELRDLWVEAENLDTATTSEVQIGILLDSVLLLERATRWFLRHCREELQVSRCVDTFTPGVREILGRLPDLLPGNEAARLRRREKSLCDQSTPAATAHRAALLLSAFPALDIVDTARLLSIPLERAAEIYFRAGDRLGLRGLQRAIAAAPVDNHWHELARIAAGDETGQLLRTVAIGIANRHADEEPAKAVRGWIADRTETVGQLQRILEELRGAATVDWAMIGVALSEARQLADRAG